MTQELFPVLTPYRTGTLCVGDGHVLYYEECGNPQGKPVLLLHGGPGAGISGTMRRFHDPGHYRMVLFDQRGCGRSSPHGELRGNTTWDLVRDIEKLRLHLDIDTWQVAGGSWGSTLALIYAQAHPQRVSELILRGIFLMRRCEILWFYQEGARWIYPEMWAEYSRHIPTSECGDMVAAYYARLTGEDHNLAMACARSWSRWEGNAITLLPNGELLDRFSDDTFALAIARIECHYFINGGFLEHENQILDRVGRIRHIPAIAIHGRYDMCTPVKNAFDLKEVWPELNLHIVANAGHSMEEPGIMRQLVAASETFKHSPGSVAAS